MPRCMHFSCPVRLPVWLLCTRRSVSLRVPPAKRVCMCVCVWWCATCIVDMLLVRPLPEAEPFSAGAAVLLASLSAESRHCFINTCVSEVQQRTFKYQPGSLQIRWNLKDCRNYRIEAGSCKWQGAREETAARCYGVTQIWNSFTLFPELYNHGVHV